jgi:hypothetical protein
MSTYLDDPEFKKNQKKLQDFLDRKFLSEAHLEDFFCREVKKAGGWSVKFNSVGTNGLPDQIVFYKGFAWVVELKTEKGIVQPHQLHIHKRFDRHGFKVRVIRNKKQVADFIHDMLNLNQ